jgi:hypothetical protein
LLVEQDAHSCRSGQPRKHNKRYKKGLGAGDEAHQHEAYSRPSRKQPRPAWRTILSLWIVANAAGLMVVSIFWYFGN